MLVADLFYQVSHSEEGGSRLHPTASGLGMAAASLAELIISGHLDIKDDIIGVHRRQQPPADLLAHEYFELILWEPQKLPLPDWLRYLSREAELKVAQRLLRHRVVDTELRGMRKRVHYLPRNASTFAGAYGYLSTTLLSGKPMADWDWFWVAALCYGTDLHRAMTEGVPESDSKKYLTWIVEQLPPAGQNLITTTKAVIADAVLTHR